MYRRSRDIRKSFMMLAADAKKENVCGQMTLMMIAIVTHIKAR